VTAPALPRAAARVAALAAELDDAEWRDATAPLAEGAPPPAREAPTFHHVAMAGLELVEALAAAGRWAEARTQAAHLATHFHATRRQLHPVAAIGFGGLHDSVRARDAEGMDDAAELIREILGGGEG